MTETKDLEAPQSKLKETKRNLGEPESELRDLLGMRIERNMKKLITKTP